MPAVEVFPYQCSPLSTPEGIKGAFDAARKYRVEGSRTIVCVLLDEVGLAEESPHLPLKVLHRELEHLQRSRVRGHLKLVSGCCQDESLCHTLYRSPPTVDDLSACRKERPRGNLQAYLQSLFRALFDVNQHGSQQRPRLLGSA